MIYTPREAPRCCARTGRSRDLWQSVDRDRRLVHERFHRLRIKATQHVLGKHLCPSDLILDGRGSGCHTIELARRGYCIVLLDDVLGRLAILAELPLSAHDSQRCPIPQEVADDWRQQLASREAAGVAFLAAFFPGEPSLTTARAKVCLLARDKGLIVRARLSCFIERGGFGVTFLRRVQMRREHLGDGVGERTDPFGAEAEGGATANAGELVNDRRDEVGVWDIGWDAQDEGDEPPDRLGVCAEVGTRSPDGDENLT